MDKVFHVVITAIDGETKEENVELDETFSGLTMLADSPDGNGFKTCILHDSVMNLATKIASSECDGIARAARLALTFADMKRDIAESSETKLLKSLLGD